jgi:hypothetical protein
MYLQPRPQGLCRIAFSPISVQNIYSVSTFRKLREENEATWMLRFNRLPRLEVAVGMFLTLLCTIIMPSFLLVRLAGLELLIKSDHKRMC